MLRKLFLVTLIIFTGSAFSEVELTQEQKIQFKKQLDADPSITCIRKYFDLYSSGKREFEIEKDVLTELGIPREKYKSTFLVYWVSGALGGGSIVTLINQDDPQMVIEVWVYAFSGETWGVKDAWLSTKSKDELDEIRKQNSRMISDKSLGI
jgi:hypothetical protein